MRFLTYPFTGGKKTKWRTHRLTALLCVLCMLISSMPVSAFASSGPATLPDLDPVVTENPEHEGEQEESETPGEESPEKKNEDRKEAGKKIRNRKRKAKNRKKRSREKKNGKKKRRRL